MEKQTDNYAAFKNFETKANEFIGLTFDYCEEELRHIRLHRSLSNPQKYQALAFAAMSVQQSIKAFWAISQIANDE